MSIAPFSLGFIDRAVPRGGGNTAEIIRQTSAESAPVAVRLVMTESRKTNPNGSSLPTEYAIITRLYIQDADGYEALNDRTQIIHDVTELETAWENAKEEAVSMGRAAFEWFLFECDNQNGRHDL